MLKEKVLNTFSLLFKASARKKVYAQKARREGRQEVSHLLRAMAQSESVQARRLLNSVRGQIDISDQYISTIFEHELSEIIEEYSQRLGEAQDDENRAMITALSQLRAAEKRIQSFYSQETKDIKDKQVEKYFVCQFCGYIAKEGVPEKCPICRAEENGFKEIS